MGDCWYADPSFAGMEQTLADRRKRPRIAAMILCEIRIGNHPPELVRVRDLTETGVKIASPRALLLGDRISVRMPGRADWTLARVAWIGDGVAGLSFARAIELTGVPGARIRDDDPGRPAPEVLNRLAG